MLVLTWQQAPERSLYDRQEQKGNGGEAARRVMDPGTTPSYWGLWPGTGLTGTGPVILGPVAWCCSVLLGPVRLEVLVLLGQVRRAAQPTWSSTEMCHRARNTTLGSPRSKVEPFKTVG